MKSPPKIAPVGLHVDFLRLAPGEAARCLPTDENDASATFLVMGEWDVLRLKPVASLFPRERDGVESPWPPLDVHILNQYSLLAHIWRSPEDGEADSDDLVVPAGEGYSFSPVFQECRGLPGLLVSVKLHPSMLKRYGIATDWSLADSVREAAKEIEGLHVFIAGGIGWQEVLFLVFAPSFDTGRSLVRGIYNLPLSGLEKEPPVARTVTYPLIDLRIFTEGSEAGFAVFEEKARPRILLDVRPGGANPVRIEGRGAVLQRPHELLEEFGTYDLAIQFPEPITIGELLACIRELGISNISGETEGWLRGCSTILDFEAASDLMSGGQESAPQNDREVLQLIAKFGRFRWRPRAPLESARLLALLRHFAGQCGDPVVSDSVAPLRNFILGLGEGADEVETTYRTAGGKGDGESQELHLVPGSIARICALLEFSVAQRSQGLQQFLFNALPGAFYGRGGLSRVLTAADEVLHEVGRFFKIESTGFVAFGVPFAKGFESFGHVVCAPLSALFELESWWVIYHEAALPIDNALFGPQAFNLRKGAGERGMRRYKESDKVVPDLITLALPFRFDLRLFRVMYAKRLVDLGREFASRLPSVAVRVMVQHLLTTAGDLAPELAEADSSIDDQLRAWQRHLAMKSRQIGPELDTGSREVLEIFLGELALFAPAYHTVPTAEKLINKFDVGIRLRGVLRELSQHLEDSFLEHQDGNSTPLVGAYYLWKMLGTLSQQPARPQGPPGEITLDLSLIADVVYNAMASWWDQEERALQDPEDVPRHRPPDLQSRLADFLTIWHHSMRAGA